MDVWYRSCGISASNFFRSAGSRSRCWRSPAFESDYVPLHRISVIGQESRRAPSSVHQSSLIARNEGIVQASLGAEEIVLMDTASGTYFQLNALASRIWELLKTTQTSAQICTTLVQEFDVETEICKHDALKYLEVLLAHGLVNIPSQ